jgi:hypothetical protein
MHQHQLPLSGAHVHCLASFLLRWPELPTHIPINELMGNVELVDHVYC